MINHGRIIFDDRTSVLKRQYLRKKIMDVRFAEPLEQPIEFEGVTTLKQGAYGVKLEFDSRRVAVDRVIQHVISSRACTDVNISDPPMEEIIRQIYTEDASVSGREEAIQ